jgi:hypothetical protein
MLFPLVGTIKGFWNTFLTSYEYSLGGGLRIVCSGVSVPEELLGIVGYEEKASTRIMEMADRLLSLKGVKMGR